MPSGKGARPPNTEVAACIPLPRFRMSAKFELLKPSVPSGRSAMFKGKTTCAANFRTPPALCFHVISPLQ